MRPRFLPSPAPVFQQLVAALFALFVVVLGGGVALFYLGEGEYGLFDTIYFSLHTVATVGYGEPPNFDSHRGARWFNAAQILAGVAAFAFFQSTLTALYVNQGVLVYFRKRRMQSSIDKLQGHHIVLGAGHTGRHVVEELEATRRRYVVVDRNGGRLQRLSSDVAPKMLFVEGDVAEDNTLLAAGIERAMGLVCGLTNDRDTLFAVVSARSLNPRLRIVAKVEEPENANKMLRAGADSVVTAHRVGGMRLASELLRPNVTEFLDQMLRTSNGDLRFEEVTIPEGSPFCDHNLRTLRIREKTQLLVVALRDPDGTFHYNPSADERLTAGVRLIVIGKAGDVQTLQALLGSDGDSD